MREKPFGDMYGGFEMRISQSPFPLEVEDGVSEVLYSFNTVSNDFTPVALQSFEASISACKNCRFVFGSSVLSVINLCRFLFARLRARGEISTPKISRS